MQAAISLRDTHSLGLGKVYSSQALIDFLNLIETYRTRHLLKTSIVQTATVYIYKFTRNRWFAHGWKTELS